jgi:UDP-N-acetylglucosamine diphosphorylase/glucosamine-1-phosphate N-acetyltransferase
LPKRRRSTKNSQRKVLNDKRKAHIRFKGVSRFFTFNFFMSNSLAVIILAAGKGTRMNNPDKAKVMFEISGKPMIDFVVRQAESLQPERIVVVVGYQKTSVIEYLSAHFPARIEFAHQDTQLGTGHAVRQTEELLGDFAGDILILSGDVPLLQASTLQSFARFHAAERAAVSVLSVIADNPSGYGRIVRDGDGAFERIVEHKDASERERDIAEINSGIYLARAALLFSALQKISNANAQGEYYLTDIIAILRASGERVVAWKSDASAEVLGVNTVEQLFEAQRLAEHFERASVALI